MTAQQLIPHVILSVAQSLDGFIADSSSNSALSSEQDLIEVHRLRASVDAIIVGIGTVLIDDPRLTVHRIENRVEDPALQPLRVIVDSTLKTPLSSRVLQGGSKTLIAHTARALEPARSSLSKLALLENCGEQEVDLLELLSRLKLKHGVKTLMLEGGGRLISSMLNLNLIAEIRMSISPVILGAGTALAPKLNAQLDSVKRWNLKSSEQLGHCLVLHLV